MQLFQIYQWREVANARAAAKVELIQPIQFLQWRDIEDLRVALEKATAAPAEEAIKVTEKEARRGMIFW